VDRRQQLLLKGRVISPDEYDLALRNRRTAQARVDANTALLKSAEEKLSYTELKADAAGVITEKGAEPGEVVQAGAMILKVAQQSGRDGIFSVPAQIIRDGLALGQPVEVWLSDNSEIRATGKIREISPQADPVTRNYQVKIELANPPAGMFLGATVVGRVNLRADSLIEIPSTALTMIGDRPAAWLVDPKDLRVHRREIAVARYTPDSVIVETGLQSGERIVTAGVQELHEGQLVKLLGEQP
jgi:RND family efflux transporter MFP subunit